MATEKVTCFHRGAVIQEAARIFLDGEIQSSETLAHLQECPECLEVASRVYGLSVVVGGISDDGQTQQGCLSDLNLGIYLLRQLAEQLGDSGRYLMTKSDPCDLGALSMHKRSCRNCTRKLQQMRQQMQRAAIRFQQNPGKFLAPAA